MSILTCSTCRYLNKDGECTILWSRVTIHLEADKNYKLKAIEIDNPEAFGCNAYRK